MVFSSLAMQRRLIPAKVHYKIFYFVGKGIALVCRFLCFSTKYLSSENSITEHLHIYNDYTNANKSMYIHDIEFITQNRQKIHETQ